MEDTEDIESNGRRATGAAVRVLVVDDQVTFRGALCDLVAATEGFMLAGEAATGEEAVALAGDLAPDLVIMDKRMPGMGGVAAARALTDRHPGIVVLLVSVEPPSDELARASGASAFLRKQDLSRRTLLAAWAEATAASQAG